MRLVFFPLQDQALSRNKDLDGEQRHELSKSQEELERDSNTQGVAMQADNTGYPPLHSVTWTTRPWMLMDISKHSRWPVVKCLSECQRGHYAANQGSAFQGPVQLSHKAKVKVSQWQRDRCHQPAPAILPTTWHTHGTVGKTPKPK